MFTYLQAFAAHFKPRRSNRVAAKFAVKLEVETLEKRLLPATIGPNVLPVLAHNAPQIQFLQPVSVAATARVGALRLEVVAQPVTVQANTPFTLVVEAVGRTGQVSSSFDGQVSVTLSGAGNSASSIMVSAVRGVADFSGLTFTGSGRFTLVISSPGLAESKVGIIVAGAPPVATNANHGQSLQVPRPVLFSVTGVAAGTNGLSCIDDSTAASDGSDSSDDSGDDDNDNDDD